MSVRDLDSLASTEFDVAVIGGGCTGTGILRDAALRGLKVVLFEKDDFASGTTSKSTRLIGGAIRYLQMLDINLVRKSLHETRVLRRIAPHLVFPIDVIIPVYKGDPYSPLAFRAAIAAYWLLGGSRGAFLNSSEAKRLEPNLPLEGLLGAAVLHEWHLPFCERLFLENIQCARKLGALAYNHTRVIELLMTNSMVCGVKVRDELSGHIADVKAKFVVNAAGPWLNEILRMLPRKSNAAVRCTKGVHLLTEQISKNAVVVIGTDGRYLYSTPIWGMSMVGTTDTDFKESIDSVYASEDDRVYLVNQYKAKGFSLAEDKIVYAIAGVRPLLPDLTKGASEVSRSWEIFDHKKDGIGGLVSVIGGNITTYRVRAKEALDAVCRKLGCRTECSTDTTPLATALDVWTDEFEKNVSDEAAEFKTEANVIKHLCFLYGSDFRKVLQLVEHDSSLLDRICQHNLDIRAEIVYAANFELTETLIDFMLDRTSIGWARCEGLDCIDAVAETFGTLKRWSKERREIEISNYKQFIELRHKYVASKDTSAEITGRKTSATN